MFEKVSPRHIDKVADRIAGALVDIAYLNSSKSMPETYPKVAIEVLIGHNRCLIIAESSYKFTDLEAKLVVEKIAGKQFETELVLVPQNPHLADNQRDKIRCGDNGIFRGVRLSEEERTLSRLAKHIYNDVIKSDGKYLISGDELTLCQSDISKDELLQDTLKFLSDYDYNITINPLGDWDNNLDNDTGVTGRKLGSDLGRAATGGCIHGKDLSKADVSVNIFLHLLLNKYNTLYSFANPYLRAKLKELSPKISTMNSIETTCNIGDETITIEGVEIIFGDIVDVVYDYIDICVGGFEKLAEWGLV